MDNVTICVSFIAGILGIAYPILLEVVSRLDEKYSSLVVLELFGKEKVRKFFSASLIACLGVLLIYILKLPPPPKGNSLGIDLANSAVMLLVIATVILIFFFFDSSGLYLFITRQHAFFDIWSNNIHAIPAQIIMKFLGL